MSVYVCVCVYVSWRRSSGVSILIEKGSAGYTRLYVCVCLCVYV